MTGKELKEIIKNSTVSQAELSRLMGLGLPQNLDSKLQGKDLSYEFVIKVFKLINYAPEEIMSSLQLQRNNKVNYKGDIQETNKSYTEINSENNSINTDSNSNIAKLKNDLERAYDIIDILREHIKTIRSTDSLLKPPDAGAINRDTTGSDKRPKDNNTKITK